MTNALTIWRPQANNIYHMDALEFTRQITPGSVQTVITSPPYFGGLRDYQVEAQWGQEDTIEQYVGRMVELFRAIRVALADDGTAWLNIGDAYAGGSGRWGGYENMSEKQLSNRGSNVHSGAIPTGLKAKDLMMIPARVAIALQADGWWLRSAIVWQKSNPMPFSGTDRPTSSYEFIYLLAKSARYYYDHEAIMEPVANSTIERLSQDIENQNGSTRGNGGAKTNGPMKAVISKQDGVGKRTYNGFNDRYFAQEDPPLLRNKRDVWTTSTANHNGNHYAVFPEELITPCVLAGSRPGDIVFDPFTGSGTTPYVAMKHGRRYLGCDINAEYVTDARERLAEPTQINLFTSMGVAV